MKIFLSIVSLFYWNFLRVTRKVFGNNDFLSAKRKRNRNTTLHCVTLRKPRGNGIQRKKIPSRKRGKGRKGHLLFFFMRRCRTLQIVARIIWISLRESNFYSFEVFPQKSFPSAATFLSKRETIVFLSSVSDKILITFKGAPDRHQYPTRFPLNGEKRK